MTLFATLRSAGKTEGGGGPALRCGGGVGGGGRCLIGMAQEPKAARVAVVARLDALALGRPIMAALPEPGS